MRHSLRFRRKVRVHAHSAWVRVIFYAQKGGETIIKSLACVVISVTVLLPLCVGYGRFRGWRVYQELLRPRKSRKSRKPSESVGGASDICEEGKPTNSWLGPELEADRATGYARVKNSEGVWVKGNGTYGADKKDREKEGTEAMSREILSTPVGSRRRKKIVNTAGSISARLQSFIRD
jgi:hypothetical protein